MLTRKQHELLMFIERHLRETGFSPSFEEMKTHLGLRSKSGVHRLITALEERGFLARRAHRARALEVLRLPESASVRGRESAAGAFAPNVIRGNFGARLAGARPASETGAVELPLLGRIAAGVPIEALRDVGNVIEVPAALLGSDGEHYALEVAGDSMVEAGILDGDTAIIRRCDTAETGAIVVALID
ncbi:MAG: transcriptional repressor LexA, partial [Elioraea sp.]|nr:transcriptional repressor LexA [Elioraea sp.]